MDDKSSKLIVYEGFSEEYFTFITPECKQAIDSYLNMRSRYGEKLNDDSYLIREQFDVRCPAKPKQFKREALQYKLYDLCKRCGIDKKDIAVAHGFRKFFTTRLVNSKINPEIREMLLGHKIQLMSAYFRPTEEEIYAEYEKAVNNLTINEENRLKIKVNQLTERQDEIELMKYKREKEMKAIRKELEPLLELKNILAKEGIYARDSIRNKVKKFKDLTRTIYTYLTWLILNQVAQITKIRTGQIK